MQKLALRPLAPTFLMCLAVSACSPELSSTDNFSLEVPESPTEQSVSALRGRFERGVVLHLDGKDYFVKGPMIDGKRDQPGHTWIDLGHGQLLGLHVNTGPLGAPSWWATGEPDGELLYIVQAQVDTWSERKLAFYRRQGFVHYHHLVTTDTNRPHPTKVLWMRHFAVRSFYFDGGPRPWLAHQVQPGLDRDYQPNAKFRYPPKEEFLYVGAVDKGGLDPDFISVIGTDETDPSTYGKIIHRTDLTQIGDEVHHYGYNITQTRLLVPGLFSGRMHLLDIETDPRHPTLVEQHDDLVPSTGYIVPHTVIALPNGGYMVTMIGANTPSTGPGGVVELDEHARFVRYVGPGPNRSPNTAPPEYMYDIGLNLIRNRAITTSFGLPGNVAPGITVPGLGDEINVWDWKNQQIIQTVKIGAGTGPLEVRWLHEPGTTIGYTNAPGSSEIWMWSDVDGDGVYDFRPAITLPPFSIPTDIIVSHDDRFLYVSNWFGNSVHQYDITDPFNPVLTAQVPIPWAQMLRLSHDGKRLYVSNSLLSTWDDDEFPPGIIRNTGYGMWKIDIADPVNGGMAIDPNFFVDFDHVQKQNTIGPARPHQAFLDPGIAIGFGDH